MRILLTFMMLLSAASTVSAQSLAAFRDTLARPVAVDPDRPDRRARVTVREWDDAAQAVAAAERPALSKVRGWRVGIYFDNSVTAREGMEEAAARFGELFPAVRVYKSYEEPYFKVRVGNCLSLEDATMLFERVRPHFPTAIIVQEQLTLPDLTEKPETPAPTTPAETEKSEK